MQMIIFLFPVFQSRDFGVPKRLSGGLGIGIGVGVDRSGARRRGWCLAFGFSLSEAFSDREDGVDDDCVDAFFDLVL